MGLSCFRAISGLGMGWVWDGIGMGWDLCAGLFYEHRFAMLIMLSLVHSYFRQPFHPEEENFFEIAEAVFVGWFTFEYVVRFIAAPRKSQ